MAKVIEAVLVLSGVIIGVGMFAIPFSFAQAGFLTGIIELLVLAAIMTGLHLMYGEIVLHTPGNHRLPGYLRIHLGAPTSRAALLTGIFGATGSLFAYILLGSLFLNEVVSLTFPSFATTLRMFSIAPQTFFALCLALCGATVTHISLKKEALINGILTILLVFFLFVVIVTLFPSVKLTNITGFSTTNLFLPYGVLLFALGGGVAIPDVVSLLGGNTRRTRIAIALGTAIPALLYLFFAYVMVGVFGTGVSPETIPSLKHFAGGGLYLFINAVGFIAVFTSFIVLHSNFQALLKFDLNVSARNAWILVSFIPLTLYFLLGLNSFVGIIGTVGALSGGADIVFTAAAYYRLKRKEHGVFPLYVLAWKYGLYALIAVGVLHEVFRSR